MTEATEKHVANSRLEHFPVTFFAIGMGMLGLTLAVNAASHAYGWPAFIGQSVLALSGTLLGLITLTYVIKLITRPAAVLEEWRHPVRIAFFPAMSIAYLLLATALTGVNQTAANVVWIGATLLQGSLALAVIGAWIGHRPFHPPQLSPAWFIPAVGNVIVPIAGGPLGHVEISWLFFSGGLLFWIVLLTLVLNRLMFHDPLPGRMVPTVMILVAPPAVAYVAWLRLAGEPGAFGHVLLSLGYVFALIVATQIKRFRGMPFTLSWWALSFPIAALSIASFAHAGATRSTAHQAIGTGLLILLAVIVGMLLVRTAHAMMRKEICVAE
ncbi:MULTISPECIES: SLAC1 anion channel family protein [Alphaproteobacteria]|uniref:Transporter n=2 Tax=Alphaproteobacteria TaxID=28211 RepID=A0A512HPH6_9HYPH|nr:MULTISPECIES: SLAC1 anion channel family protein [Alphaproteobacteria]GEO87366.1 transporter [Ciceribacter naphthalenivorans]GLR24052.1 transporter [Ciceribacter naphthalenivorans]GLT06908.1 transporter [Sphingomonas psychrolutea]